MSPLIPSTWEMSAPYKLLLNKRLIEAIDSELCLLICQTEEITIWRHLMVPQIR